MLINFLVNFASFPTFDKALFPGDSIEILKVIAVFLKKGKNMKSMEKLKKNIDEYKTDTVSGILPSMNNEPATFYNRNSSRIFEK